MIQETFDANLVDIDTTGTSFIPEWNLTGDEVSVQPNGTVTGTTFSANWTTCEYNGSETFKRVWTWTGTLNAGETAFTGSKALEVITYANGDQTGSATLCNAVATPTGDACNNPGLTWTLSGTKN